MKEYMSIVGCKLTGDNQMEIALVPLTGLVKKKKVGFMDLASGDMESLIGMIPKRQNETIIYVGMEQWGAMKLMIGRHVSIEILPDDTTGGLK
jgi:hypothetical protein